MTTAAQLGELTERLTALAQSAGLRVLLVPPDEEPMGFGAAVRTSLGATEPPGAMTMTWIETSDAAEEAEVERRGEAIVAALAAAPGFIGFVGTSFAGRGHTFTAWTSLEAAEEAIAGNQAHHEARNRFLRGPLGQRGFTSVWVPHRLNPQHLRCPGCGIRHAIRPGAVTRSRCRCGSPLEAVPYF